MAAYGKEIGNQTFYGFRLYVKINSLGVIQTFELAPANIHDIKMLPEPTRSDSVMLLADRAYLSEPFKQQLLEQQGLELSIPTKCGESTHLSQQELCKRKMASSLDRDCRQPTLP
jgi:hypothetical protein